MTDTAPARSNDPTAAGIDATVLSLYAGVVLTWGLSWYAMRQQIGVVAPEVSVVWRFVIAVAVMLAWALAIRARLRFPWRSHLVFAAAGLGMFSSNFALYYHAAQWVPSGLLAVSFSLASVLNLAIGVVVMRQPFEARLAIGGVVGVAGVAAMFAPEIARLGFGGGAGLGLVLSFAGTLSFCFGNLASAAAQKRGVPMVSANLWGMVYGVIWLAAIALVRGAPFVMEWTPRYLVSLVYLAIGATVVAFAAYVGLVRRIGPPRAAYTTVLFPVVALAVSTELEDYVWTWTAALGLLLALAGNLIVLSAPPRRRASDLES